MKTDERPRTLDHVVPELRDEYGAWKAAEARKNALRDEFFQFADQALREMGLALSLVAISASTEDEAVSRALQHNPGWVIDTYRPHRVEKDIWEFVLTEDPSLLPFSHEHDGYKVARTVSRGPVMMDDEWLQQELPEVYEKVTYLLPWGERVPVPIDQLDSELIGAISKYIYNGKPQVRLAAPRKVKDEE